MRRILAMMAIGLLAGCTTLDPEWEASEPIYQATTQGNYVQFADCVMALTGGLELRTDEANQVAYVRYPRPWHPIGLGRHEIPMGELTVEQLNESYIHVAYRRADTFEQNGIVRKLKICVA